MPKLPVTDRFYARGTTKVHFLPVIAAATMIPTRAEITAGTDLSDEISDMTGWTTTSGSIGTPDLGSRFNRKIPGDIDSPDSSLTIYASRDGNDVRKVLPRDTVGYIVFMDAGDVPGRLMDIFAISVASVGKTRSMGAALVCPINMTITRVPVEDKPIPAAA